MLLAIINYIYNGFIRWPALAWKIRGYCTVSFCSYDIKFGISILENALPYFELRKNRKEPEVINVLCNTLEEGGVFFDVWAYHGYYTLIGSKVVGQSGHVIAFEPDPVARSKLKKNVTLNNARNVDIVPYALSNSSGEKNLIAPLFGRSISKVRETPLDGLQKRVDIATITLDEFIKKYGIRPNVIKIDVEGHEDKVFEGGRKPLSEKNLIILLELHINELIDKNVNPYALYKKFFKLNKFVFFLTHKKLIPASVDILMEQWPSNYFIIAPRTPTNCREGGYMVFIEGSRAKAI